MYNHFDNILSQYQCGFRKGHSAQHRHLPGKYYKLRRFEIRKGFLQHLLQTC